MKTFFKIASLLIAFNICAQKTETNFWKVSLESEVKLSGMRQIIPKKYAVYNLSLNEFKTQLSSATNDRSANINQSNCIINLPLPNGQMQSFQVIESPIMEDKLAASFPNIKTYSLKGITDPFATGKIDITEFGFHGMIKSANGDFFIDPYCLQNTSDYISYYVSDFEKPIQYRSPEMTMIGTDPKAKESNLNKVNAIPTPAACSGQNLRTYRLAIACTGEYAVAATGSTTPTLAQTLAKIVTSINRVDGVYETEVAVRLVLVATETNVVFTDATTDPFTGNNNASTLINESQTVITNSIGTSNFDIGHTFSTGGGGLAALGVVCSASQKANGITGSANPVGDPYDIDYVSHEMGHQFGADHCFNSINSACGGGNRTAATAVEPGSGVTIMAYAGICGSDDLASNSIAYFHGVSFDQIIYYTTLSAGNGCAVTTTSGNNPPVVAGITGSYVLPASTPFTLTGSATDPDGDPLTYSWEQIDLGPAGAWNSGSSPFFRSYVPSNSPTRSFPILSSVLTNSYQTVKGEFLASTSQTLNFRLTARDNKMGGGGVCYAFSTVSVNANAGPFQITYPNAPSITWGMGMQQNISWDVNNTNLAPVNVNSVNILISYDSGNTFTTLVANSANDGVEVITVPTLSTNITTCRIKIESVGNIFYDINTPDFTIATSVAGVPEISGGNALGLFVFPNPFTNSFNLKAGALSGNAKTEISITDVLGKEVKHLSFDKINVLDEHINLSELDAAVYFITVMNGTNKTTARIIKN